MQVTTDLIDGLVQECSYFSVLAIGVTAALHWAINMIPLLFNTVLWWLLTLCLYGYKLKLFTMAKYYAHI